MAIGMRPSRWSGLLCVALFTAPAANAIVVLDPVPLTIQPGMIVGLEQFVTAPQSSFDFFGSSRVQQMEPLRDGSGRMYITDMNGVVSMTNKSGATPSPYFDIRSQGVGMQITDTQEGLVSVAFHPNFGVDRSKPGYNVFYTIDTVPPSGHATFAGNGTPEHNDEVREWTVADPTASTATIVSQREVASFAQPFSDHGPGTIAFNPTAGIGSADYGKLYIGLGDGGHENDPNNNAQDLSSPFGKILRIDPADPDGSGPKSYSVPADNPFIGQSGKLGEVWAYGLRNPQQFSWDAATGKMYIAEIGQAQVEEVDLGTAGANYGWPIREGTFGRSADKTVDWVYDVPNPGYVDPIAQYDHGEGSAIGGARLYNGSLIPALDGKMLTSDLVNGRLFYFTPSDTYGPGGLPLLSELLLEMNGSPITVLELEGYTSYNFRTDLRLGTDEDGEIYLLTKLNGDTYKLIADAVPEPASWLTIVAGMGLCGATLRRRRVALGAR